MKLLSSEVLMLSGMLAIVFYVVHVVIGGIKWKGYSHLQQPISDLTATGAPNRALMLTLTNVYGLLALLFAVSFAGLKSGELIICTTSKILRSAMQQIIMWE